MEQINVTKHGFSNVVAFSQRRRDQVSHEPLRKNIKLKVSNIDAKASTRSEIDCISSGYFSLFRNREGKLNRFMYCLDI